MSNEPDKIIANKIDRLEKVMSNILRRMNVYDNEIQLQREDMESIRVVVSSHAEGFKNLITTNNNISNSLDVIKKDYEQIKDYLGLTPKSKQSIETDKKDNNNDNKNDDVDKHD